MKLIKNIENVNAYLLNKEIVLRGNEIISLKDNVSIIIDEAFRLFDLGEEILVLDDSNIPVFFTLSMEQVKKDIDYRVFYVSPPYLGLYKKKPIYVDAIYDYIHSKVLFQTENPLNGLVIIKNYIFTDDIICRDLHNGELLWQFDLLSIVNNPHNDIYNKAAAWEVKKFIGVLEDKLWIALNHHTIIALDVKTGQLMHRIDRIANFKCDWLPSAIPLSEATAVDEKNKKLVGFMWEFYWEIDPRNGAITLFDLTDELVPQKIRNDRVDFVLTDSHIYFASNSDIKVGALNRNTKQVDWFHAFEDNGIGYQSRIKKIDGNDDKLGVLTNEKVLYIFEKE